MIHFRGLSFYLLLFVFISFFSSCNNELELVGPKVEVPIVYGTISATDPFVFVRLERAFGDNKISPTVLAKKPDSLYYNDAQVFISIKAENFKVQLERVDATTLGFPRDTGVFANTPNYIYVTDKSNFIFKPGAEYDLEIIVRGKTYTSKTLLINEVTVSTPKAGSPIQWNPRVNETTNQSPRFVFDPTGSVRDADPAIVNLTIKFNYFERDVATSTEYVEKSLLIPVAESVILTDNDFRYSANKIFAEIGQKLVRSASIDRYFDSVDFILTTGGKEFVSYNEALAANAGITGTQDFPIFTNISGGFGIFSSKNTQVFEDYYLNDLTLDSLAISRYTSGLNFRK